MATYGFDGGVTLGLPSEGEENLSEHKVRVIPPAHIRLAQHKMINKTIDRERTIQTDRQTEDR